jgi:hypothetical protein
MVDENWHDDGGTHMKLYPALTLVALSTPAMAQATGKTDLVGFTMGMTFADFKAHIGTCTVKGKVQHD